MDSRRRAGWVGLGAALALAAEGARRARRGGSTPVRKAVTVGGRRDEVEGAWARWDERPRAASVRFQDAPGDRGTEVVVEVASGDANEIAAGLRRFKQIVETGEVVRSDAIDEAKGLLDYPKQRPAQPEEVAR